MHKLILLTAFLLVACNDPPPPSTVWEDSIRSEQAAMNDLSKTITEVISVQPVKSKKECAAKP